MAQNMALPLKGKWIVITRPKHQSMKLQALLEKAGANTLLFPLLEIKPADDIAQARQSVENITDYDLVIFTSANAVDYALKLFTSKPFKPLKIAAIGKKTASVLKQAGLSVDFFPVEGFNSEAFLALDEIKAFGKGNSIAIVRGQGGRSLLKNQLEAQGVKVRYIDVYQRFFPHQNLAMLEQHAKKNQLDVIILSSGTSLKNLFNFLPENKWLSNVVLLAGSQRIKEQVLAYPEFQGKLLNTHEPSDEAVYRYLLNWAL